VFDSSRVCSSGWATNFLVLSPDPITLNQNASPNTLTHTPLGDKWGGSGDAFCKIPVKLRVASGASTLWRTIQ
jgi:hypothetical protein